jgi:single-stranded DNA-binding protein
MNETTINMAGNLVAPAELRYTPSGAAVASFRLASTAARVWAWRRLRTAVR